jgi:hypothetical protein
LDHQHVTPGNKPSDAAAGVDARLTLAGDRDDRIVVEEILDRHIDGCFGNQSRRPVVGAFLASILKTGSLESGDAIAAVDACALSQCRLEIEFAFLCRRFYRSQERCQAEQRAQQ